jgi:SNF2 family DNA or RNA helicase
MAQRNEMRFDLERRLPRKKNPKKVKCDIDVVLTTFSYFSGNKSDDRKFLRRFDFEYMVIDEAHCLKNPDSNAYQNLDRFDTAHRLL